MSAIVFRDERISIAGSPGIRDQMGDSEMCTTEVNSLWHAVTSSDTRVAEDWTARAVSEVVRRRGRPNDRQSECALGRLLQCRALVERYTRTGDEPSRRLALEGVQFWSAALLTSDGVPARI